MEVFIIVIAAIAVVAALLLLLLLQIRIKRQSSEGPAACEASIEEIASADPNDPCLKTGPPPYREVMKTPELYPLSSSCNVVFGEAKIRISSSCADNERSKRTWAQLMTAVLRPDDLVPDSRPEKHSPVYEGNHFTFKLQESISDESKRSVDDCKIVVHESTSNDDEVLPTYHEACLASEPTDSGQLPPSTLDSDCELGQYELRALNLEVARTALDQEKSALSISNALQGVVVDTGNSIPRSATM